MQRTVSFFQNELIGAVAKNGNGFTSVLDSSDFDDTGTGRLNFVNEFGVTEFVFGEGIDIGNGFAANTL